MSQLICAACKRELRGAREFCIVFIGSVLMVLLIDTPDCNWRNCTTCGKPICKTCYKAREKLGPVRGPDRVVEVATPFQ